MWRMLPVSKCLYAFNTSPACAKMMKELKTLVFRSAFYWSITIQHVHRTSSILLIQYLIRNGLPVCAAFQSKTFTHWKHVEMIINVVSIYISTIMFVMEIIVNKQAQTFPSKTKERFCTLIVMENNSKILSTSLFPPVYYILLYYGHGWRRPKLNCVHKITSWRLVIIFLWSVYVKINSKWWSFT